MDCSRETLFRVAVLLVGLLPISGTRERATVGHGTSEVLLVGAGKVVFAADSREIYSVFLSDGRTQTSVHETCKVRRAGALVAVAAGYIRANEFNVLDFIEKSVQEGEELPEFADRLTPELASRLQHAIGAARELGDEALRRNLESRDALEVALIGAEAGQPAVELMMFRMGAAPRRYRCPGDCPDGRGAFFMGVHSAIDAGLRAEPELRSEVSAESARRLIGLEYAGEPELVGGPMTVMEVDADGPRVLEAGVCSSEEPVPALTLRRMVEELEGRMAAATNLVCHQTIHRRTMMGRQRRHDVIEAELRILGNRESYSEIRQNGRSYESFTGMRGAWSSGELLTMLQASRAGLMAGDVRLERRGAGDTEEFGARFRHGMDARMWQLYVDAAAYPVGFDGTVWFDARDGSLRSIEWRSAGSVAHPRMKIRDLQWGVRFLPFELAGEQVMAPAAASYVVGYQEAARREERVETVFSDYRRFGATGRLLE